MSKKRGKYRVFKYECSAELVHAGVPYMTIEGCAVFSIDDGWCHVHRFDAVTYGTKEDPQQINLGTAFPALYWKVVEYIEKNFQDDMHNASREVA